MEKIPYDEDLDKLLWMRHNLSFNVAIYTPDFTDEDLRAHFGDEPVWIVAAHVGFHLIFHMLGLDALCRQTEDEVPFGFGSYVFRHGPTAVEFNMYRPKKVPPAELLADEADQPAAV